MKKVFGYICIAVVVLCLLHHVLGVRTAGDKFDSGFRIEPKLQAFVNADVFDYNQEVIEIQTMEWYFESAVSQGSASVGEFYATYQVLGRWDPAPEGHEYWTAIYDTNGEVVMNVWRQSHLKEDANWFGELANFATSIFSLIASCFRLIGVFFVSMFQALGALVRLVIEIVFLP